MKTYTEYRAEAEILISQNPALLLKKIHSIVLVSYAYFAGLVIGWLAVIGGLTAIVYYIHRINLLIVAVFIAACTSIYIIVKSFIYRITFPQSYELSPQSYPELFTAIHEFEQKLSVKIDKVYLDENLNAGVIQDPRFGVLGGYRNVLRIGLQLLLLLSKDEFRSVLAHELAHISNNDSRSTGSVNRIRQSWSYLLSNIPENKYNSIGVKPILWYLKRMWPKMDAYTFAYSRMCEYKADEFSAQCTGVQVWAEGITKMYVSNQYTEVFWDRMNNESRSSPEPLRDTYDRLVNYFTEPLDEQKLQEWIRVAAFARTRDNDTHPSFEDRLLARNIDISAHSLYELVRPQSEQSAAKEYFGSKYEKIVTEFNQKRFFESSKQWEEYLNYQKELDSVIAETATTDETVWKKIGALIQRNGLQSIESYIDQILDKKPEDPKARVHKAIILLDRSDAEGEVMMQKLIEEKLSSIIDVFQFLYAYYSRNNMREKARDLEKKADEEYKKSREVSSEVNELASTDRLAEHMLPQDVLGKIQEFGAKNAKYIKNIHVAKRILKSDPSIETYVFSILTKSLFSWDKSPRVDLVNEFIKELQIKDSVVFIWEHNLEAYGRKVKQIPHSLVYGQEQLLHIYFNRKYIYAGLALTLICFFAYPSLKYKLRNMNGQNIQKNQKSLILIPSDDESKNIWHSFEQYRAGLLNNDTTLAINYMSESTISYAAQMFGLIKYGPKTEIKKLRLVDQVTILAARCRFDKSVILNFDLTDGTEALELFINNGFISKDNLPGAYFYSVDVKGDEADLQIVNPSKALFLFHLIKESGEWKIDLTPIFSENNVVLEKDALKSGVSEDEFILNLLSSYCPFQPTEQVWEPVAW